MSKNRDKLRKAFVFAFFVSLLSVFSASSPAFADNTGGLANLDSVEVPAKSRHVMIDNAYISPGGHLVLQTNGQDDGTLRVNFFDAQLGDWLLPEILTTQADLAREQEKLTQGGFVKLEHMPMITLENGTRIFNFIDAKNLCFGPYADFIEFAPKGSEPIESAVYLKRDDPETVYSVNDTSQPPRSLVKSHRCKSAAGGNPALTVGYRQESPFFFSDRAGGFFMLLSRYAIHFTSNGQSAFFKGQENPVFLDTENARVMRGILAAADKNGNPQDAIDQADELIAKTSKTQAEQVQ